MSASKTPELTDFDLVAAYRQGDERAATELVRRHAGAIGRFLYSSGAGPSDLDDLVQETFFRAFRRLGGWRAEASFSKLAVLHLGQPAPGRLPQAERAYSGLDRRS